MGTRTISRMDPQMLGLDTLSYQRVMWKMSFSPQYFIRFRYQVSTSFHRRPWLWLGALPLLLWQRPWDDACGEHLCGVHIGKLMSKHCIDQTTPTQNIVQGYFNQFLICPSLKSLNSMGLEEKSGWNEYFIWVMITSRGSPELLQTLAIGICLFRRLDIVKKQGGENRTW